ncbi:glycoside hydrolase family 43 protein [Desertivirga brevis]|uniref:glycoside hydrolase family 43 protein n=1 Tax=Desertivirga brevis TaxID=2810310 RepID=UPI001A979A90|nr:glycoside hydrolase family 43 protein [Pedobacter sp. SYSU D00873]
MNRNLRQILLAAMLLSGGSCLSQDIKNSNVTGYAGPARSVDTLKIYSKPLVADLYTADPSAHVFDGKIFIYPSHDIESNAGKNNSGDGFDMKDYHVFSMTSVGGQIKDHGVALDIKSIPWAGKQLWAPDVAFKNGKYFLYFPLKDKQGVFRIGVATSNKPEGPYKAEAAPIEGSYSIDPAVFTDSDGSSYMYFGGIWGGQLQQWEKGIFNPQGSDTDLKQDDQPAITPKVAKLKSNMLEFAEPVRNVEILDEAGNLLKGGDHDRRFFEAAWLHKYKGKYYFSYSTGDTHRICYATGSSPYGPFTYQGVILKPVLGWTNHHSILEYKGKWYMFYHDSELSDGKTNLRNIKVAELHFDKEGRILPMDAMQQEPAKP